MVGQDIDDASSTAQHRMRTYHVEEGRPASHGEHSNLDRHRLIVGFVIEGIEAVVALRSVS